MSWEEVQDLPQDVYDLWQAFLAGEGDTRKKLIDQAKKKQSVQYVR